MKLVQFFKDYQLRWLFYRRRPNFVLGKNNFTATERCCKCKKGVSHFLAIWTTECAVSYCPHCKEELVKEANTSLLHKLWEIKNKFWQLLDYLHICRNTTTGRYDIFGDEHYFVKATMFDKDWNLKRIEFRPRKWWEYIFIKRR